MVEALGRRGKPLRRFYDTWEIKFLILYFGFSSSSFLTEEIYKRKALTLTEQSSLG